ncbi:ArsR/SmtB family transcription factor [Propylenella binzhouense]|uniref:ArsR family transcriptional regulator n=1 Tax=Propylenella binzhouense TaxID=2555902 RepID=A0A964T865_9HYPH|nr:metalloregulator ArsR/SmtB family transcription factor [Propylenella binzhouense]MYZ49122.1 ArsR family transcriptional regulator [Propylenella binzhouense]
MQTQELDKVFHALSDPCRRAMVERLSRGPASVKEIAAPMRLALPSAVKHLKVLEEGGIVRSTKTGRVRTYGMRPHGLDPVADWVRQREAALNAAFDRLAEAMAAFPEECDDR